MQQIAEHTTIGTLRQKPKTKKIEDIVKPTATMRLHQRLFDRRRKHHIDVQGTGASQSPGKSLNSYLIHPKYHKTKTAQPAPAQTAALITSAPAKVLQYSQITRDLPEENYLHTSLGHTRSLTDRIAQRYRVFIDQRKPFYYSLGAGATSGWLTNPRAPIALAGSALALLLFFTGKPPVGPTGPDNPADQNPIVIQDASRENNPPIAETLPATSGGPSTTPNSQTGASAATGSSTAYSQASSTENTPTLTNGGGYGSGPTPTSSTTTSQVGQTDPVTQTSTTPTNLIQDIVKPTPVTIPGQDVLVDDKRIIQTSDTTVLIN